MLRLLLLGVLSFGLLGVAVADDEGGNSQGQNDQGDPVRMPEPSQAVSAIALLGGTALVLRTRLKK